MCELLKKFKFFSERYPKPSKTSDSESDNEEFTIANDLVVTKNKMAGDVANRLVA